MRCNSAFLRRLVVPAGALVVVWACGGGDLTLPGSIGPATNLLMVSGNGQSAPPGTELPTPLVVRLVDAQGNGIEAGSVTWVIGTGGGSVSPGSVETDTAGLASARLTLGQTLGTNTVSAVVSGVAVVTFSASAIGGGDDDDRTPDHLVFQVQPSDAVKGERIDPPVVVAVVNRNGDVVTDFKIKIEVVLAEGSGKLEGKREQETENGLATFDDLKIDEAGDRKVLRALAPEEPFLGTVESRPFRVEEEEDDFLACPLPPGHILCGD